MRKQNAASTSVLVRNTREAMIQISRYLHTAILVSDLEKADFFYGTVLGLPPVDRSLKFPGRWYQIGEVQIHLIVQEGLSQTIANEAKWGRNPHLALAVTDLDAAKAQLEKYGYALQMSASGRSAAFTQDPDGNVVELTQVKSER